MDFETVIVEQPCFYNNLPCRIEMDCEITWERGELIDVRLPIIGGFQIGDSFVSISDFIKDSETKYIKMSLLNFLGEEVDTQVVNPGNLEYLDDGNIVCYYEVDEIVTNKLRPGSYQLYVYLINTLPKLNESIGERTVLNTLLTDLEGLEVTIV